MVIDEPVKLHDIPLNYAQGENLAKNDFSGLGKKYRVDKLLLIDVTVIGFERSYASYFPTSDPKSVVRMAWPQQSPPVLHGWNREVTVDPRKRGSVCRVARHRAEGLLSPLDDETTPQKTLRYLEGGS